MSPRTPNSPDSEILVPVHENSCDAAISVLEQVQQQMDAIIAAAEKAGCVKEDGTIDVTGNDLLRGQIAGVREPLRKVLFFAHEASSGLRIHSLADDYRAVLSRMQSRDQSAILPTNLAGEIERVTARKDNIDRFMAALTPTLEKGRRLGLVPKE